MNLDQTHEVTIILEDGEIETEYKLTLGECSNYRKGLYERYRKECFGEVADEYAALAILTDEQKSLNEIGRYFAVKDKLGIFDGDLMASKLDAAISHAMILVSTHLVQKRVGDVWERGTMPDFWYSPMRAAELIPNDLRDALLRKVFEITPARVFGFVSIDPNEKKALRLTVQPSKN